MKQIIRTLFVALTVVAALAAPAPAQEAVKVGVIQPLSGSVAASGNYVRMGAEIGRDWINAKGGVLGRKVELLIEDNKSDPKEAATAAEKLIVRDKVPVIVGAWGSSMTLAAMPKLEEYGVPMIVETSSAATITKRGNPWVFRISPPSEMEALGRAGGHRRVHGAGGHRHERADHQGEGRARRHAVPHPWIARRQSRLPGSVHAVRSEHDEPARRRCRFLESRELPARSSEQL